MHEHACTHIYYTAHPEHMQKHARAHTHHRYKKLGNYNGCDVRVEDSRWKTGNTGTKYKLLM